MAASDSSSRPACRSTICGGCRRAARRIEALGYSSGDRAGDQPRPVPAAGHRRRAHDAARARHVGGDRLPARADGRRADRLGPAALLQGPLRPRPRQPGAQAQRGALLACKWTAPVARMREYIQTLRAIWDSWQTRHQAGVRRRALPLHVHDAVLQSGPDRASAHPGRDLGGQSGDVPARRRALRRRAPAQLLHPPLSRRRDPAQHRRAAPPRRDARSRTSSSPAAASSPPAPTTQTRAASRSRASAARSRSTARRRRTSACSRRTAGATSASSSTSCRATASGRRWRAAVPDDVVHAFAAVGRYDEIVPRIRERFRGVAPHRRSRRRARTPATRASCASCCRI